MTTATIPRATEAAAIVGARWQLDPAHTIVEFGVKHLMISTVRGRFGRVAGSVFVDPASLAAPEVEVLIEAASIETHEARRDEHLRSADFLEVAKYPTITFIGRRIEGDPSAEFRLIGDLTIRGVTRQVVLDASFEGSTKDPWGGDRLGFSARARLNRKDFGLRWNVALETGGVMVGDEVKLSIDAQLVKETRAKATAA